MTEHVLNSREELYTWIKENCKLFERTAYVNVLETSANGFSIILAGGSDNGGVSTAISFPTQWEQYPMEFKLFEAFGKTAWYPYGTNPPKLLQMLLRELIKRGI